MIKPTNRRKEQRRIRRWAKDHQEEIYEALGRFCNEEKCKTTDDLTIHHKEYKKGLKYVEILCNKCHRSFHDKEMKKKLLIICMKEINSFNESDKISDLKIWLQKKIDDIKVDIIPNLKIDGLPK